MSFDLFNPAPTAAAAPPSKLVGRGIPLRWCQREDCDALMHALESGHKRPCCVGATGSGKGAIIAETAGRLLRDGKVVAVVDRAHLVHQLADEIERHLSGVTCGRVADGVCEGIGRRVVVATVQAMYTPDRSGRPLYAYPQFRETKTVIADEAHKFFAPAFRGVLSYFAEEHGAVVPLFTATPVASNGARWESFVDWTAGDEGPCMRTVGWCVRNGYLVPPRQAFIRVDLDLSSIYERLAGSDPDSLGDDEDDGDELAGLLVGLLKDKGEQAAARFATGVADVIGERRAIVFSPARVAAAKLLSSWLNATGRIKCDAVWGGRADKSDVLDQFRAGHPQALTSVNILCEGFNCPDVSAVFMCRLLKQWRLVAQMVGRGLRPSVSCVPELNRLDDPGQCAERRQVIASSEKPDALIADLVGIDGKVMQASAVDVLYAEEPEDVRHEIAEAKFSKSMKPRPDDSDPSDDELEEARAALLKRQHEQLAEMARRRAMAGALTADVSVTYGDGGGVSVPTVPTPRAGATLGERAMFVAVALQYDVNRAADIADRTPRHVLKGMTFSMKKKLEKEGTRPDWQRARNRYPEWAADLKTRKAGAR